jgi:hypothetical protein
LSENLACVADTSVGYEEVIGRETGRRRARARRHFPGHAMDRLVDDRHRIGTASSVEEVVGHLTV